MDQKHKDLIGLHRSKFVQCVDVKRLMPFMQENEVLSVTDVEVIHRQQSRGGKVERLLDILQFKGNHAFQTLCLALETTYPHLLTVMFLGGNNKATGSTNTSIASDSEEDGARFSMSTGCVDSPRIFLTPSPQSTTSQDYDLQQNNLALLKAELKLVTSDRDTLRKELIKQTQSERDSALKRLSMNVDASSRLIKQGVSNSDKSLSSSRDYEWLKTQCDKAMSELQALAKTAW
ncbi:hypothetical protein GQR58_014911 [Nymphon striatum]|nr:hypothetical protein GQR58_014911 [Nymphon striatum]